MSLRRVIVALLAVQAALLESHLGLGHGIAPMAIVLVEGFDHLTNAELTGKGWSAISSGMVAGQYDGQAVQLSGGSAIVMSKTLPSSYSTIFVGFGFQFSATPSGGSQILTLQNGATIAFRVEITTADKIAIFNAANTLVATGTTVLTPGNWYYIEVEAVIAGASGQATVKLDGATEIAATTGNFGSSNIDTISLRAVAAGVNVKFDNIYAADTTGSAPNNTFLGSVRVETIYPNADGAHTAWTPNAGSTHYTQVNEAQADGDTTYVSDATPGDIDTYAFGDIDVGATVYAVQKNLYARKDDAGTRQIAPVTRQGGTDYVGATITLASSYSTFSQLDNQDPTGANWTPTTVNADEFGVKEIA